MEEKVAYNIMTDFGVDAMQAAAFSRIFATEDTPENRTKLVEGMEKAGFKHRAAEGLVDLFLDREKQS